MKHKINRNILTFCGFLLLSVTLFSCREDRLTHHKEWGAFFEENDVNGCVMWNNLNEATFGVYGFGAIQKRLVPAETFHIVLALAGLETGVIRDTNMVIPDALAGPKTSGVTMGEAFRHNNNAYFKWVGRTIGQAKMKYWLDSTYYGNKKMGSDITSYWTDRTLKISPDEQLGLVQRLYLGGFAYQDRTERLVKELMLKKVAHDDTLYYQQGVGDGKDGTVGWLVGWLKRKDEVHLFSIKALDKEQTDKMNTKTLNILYDIFGAKGWLTASGRLK